MDVLKVLNKIEAILRIAGTHGGEILAEATWMLERVRAAIAAGADRNGVLGELNPCIQIAGLLNDTLVRIWVEENLKELRLTLYSLREQVELERLAHELADELEPGRPSNSDEHIATTTEVFQALLAAGDPVRTH